MSNLEGKWSARVLWIGLVLFVLALVLRVLFLQAMPEAAGPYNPYYKGDTPTSIAIRLPVGVCAPKLVSLRHSCS